jgi:hypothetical protein
VTPGTYVWTWGSGANADSFTLDIEATAVPEPSGLLLFGGGLAALLLWRTARYLRNRNLRKPSVRSDLRTTPFRDTARV